MDGQNTLMETVPPCIWYQLRIHSEFAVLGVSQTLILAVEDSCPLKKKKHHQVSEFYYFEVSKESEIQVANIKQGRTPGQAVFAGVANQAEDEEAVDDVDVVTVVDREPSQGESQPSQPSQSQP